MAQKLFDHINAITTIQDPKYFDKLSEEDFKTWSNFMINRFLSMKPEWVELIASILPLTQTLQPKEMYTMLYDKVDEYATGNVANVILTIADGLSKDALVVDKEIVFMSTIIQILNIIK